MAMTKSDWLHNLVAVAAVLATLADMGKMFPPAISGWISVASVVVAALVKSPLFSDVQ